MDRRYLYKVKKLGRALGFDMNIVKSKVRRASSSEPTNKMHGHKIPRNAKEAMEFHNKNGNKNGEIPLGKKWK